MHNVNSRYTVQPGKEQLLDEQQMIAAIVMDNYRVTVIEIITKMNISHGSGQLLLHDRNIQNACNMDVTMPHSRTEPKH